MDFDWVVRRRRMVRAFRDEAVPPGVLDCILDVATRSPSAGNSGGWHLVVLEGPEQTGAFWEATTTPDWRIRSRRWEGLARAPVVVALFTSPDAYLERYAEDDKRASGLGAGEGAWPVPYWFVDAGMASMALLLAVTDADLGACFLGNFRGESTLASSLGVPAGWRYAGAVVIGHAADDDAPSASLSRGRRQRDVVVHRGRW